MGSIIQSVGTRRWTSQAPPNSRQKQCKRCGAPPLFLDGSKLLQLSNIELSSFLEEELERNPLLERSDGEGEGTDDIGSDAPDDHASSTEAFGEGDETPVVDSADLTDREVLPDANDAPLDLDYETTFTSDGHDEAPIVADAGEPLSSNWSMSTGGGDNSGTDSIIERMASRQLASRTTCLANSILQSSIPSIASLGAA